MSAISYIGIQGLRGPQGEKGDPGVGTDAVLSVNGELPDVNGNVEIVIPPAEDAVLSVNGELPDENGNVVIQAGGATEGPFVTALPLTSRLVMAPTTITGPVAFTVGLTPGLMVETYVKLTADGTNTPTFAGMTEWGGSLGWDNTAGMVNNLAFFNDGSTTYYSIAQDLGATPIPQAPGIPTLSLGTVSDTSIGLTWTLPSGGTPTDYIVEFRETAGTWATFTDGVSTARSATVTGLTPETGYEFRVSATNAVGTSGTSNVISQATIATPVVTVIYPKATAIYRMTETGNAGTGWIYEGTSAPTFDDRSVFGDDPLSTGDSGYFAGNIAEGAGIGFTTSATSDAWLFNLEVVFAIYVSSGNVLLKKGDQVNQTPSEGALPVPANSIFRIRRAGATTYAEYSVDAMETWTIFDISTTATTVGTGTVYPYVMGHLGAPIGPVISEGTS